MTAPSRTCSFGKCGSVKRGRGEVRDKVRWERKGKGGSFRKGDRLGKTREKEMKGLKVGERRMGGEGANLWHGTRSTRTPESQRQAASHPLSYPFNTYLITFNQLSSILDKLGLSPSDSFA